MATERDRCPDVRFGKDCPRCLDETVDAKYWAETGTYPTRLCLTCGWTTYDSVAPVCIWCGLTLTKATPGARYCWVTRCKWQAHEQGERNRAAERAARRRRAA